MRSLSKLRRMGLLASLMLCVNGAQADITPINITPQFNHDGTIVTSGALIWKKSDATQYKYSEAAAYCDGLKADTPESKWRLPSKEQLYTFGQEVIQPQKAELDKFQWQLGSTWIQDKDSIAEHRYMTLPNFGVGEVPKVDSDRVKMHALCVQYGSVEKNGNYFDGKRTWSKVVKRTNLMTYKDAQNYCANYKTADSDAGAWFLPERDQLMDFVSKVVAQRVLDNQGWWISSVPLWSSTADKQDANAHYAGYFVPGTSPGPYIFSRADKDSGKTGNVTCVRNTIQFGNEWIKIDKGVQFIKKSAGGIAAEGICMVGLHGVSDYVDITFSSTSNKEKYSHEINSSTKSNGYQDGARQSNLLTTNGAFCAKKMADAIHCLREISNDGDVCPLGQ